jgi:hypothetical protein
MTTSRGPADNYPADFCQWLQFAPFTWMPFLTAPFPAPFLLLGWGSFVRRVRRRRFGRVTRRLVDTLLQSLNFSLQCPHLLFEHLVFLPHHCQHRLYTWRRLALIRSRNWHSWWNFHSFQFTSQERSFPTVFPRKFFGCLTLVFSAA